MMLGLNIARLSVGNKFRVNPQPKIVENVLKYHIMPKEGYLCKQSSIFRDYFFNLTDILKNSCKRLRTL